VSACPIGGTFLAGDKGNRIRASPSQLIGTQDRQGLDCRGPLGLAMTGVEKIIYLKIKLFSGIIPAKNRIQNTEYRIQNTEYRIQNTEYRIQNTEYRIQNTEDIRQTHQEWGRLQSRRQMTEENR